MGYITAEHFTYRYPEQEKPALSDITFSLDRGEILLLLRKSGSGKSTLGKAIPIFLRWPCFRKNMH